MESRFLPTLDAQYESGKSIEGPKACWPHCRSKFRGEMTYPCNREEKSRLALIGPRAAGEAIQVYRDVATDGHHRNIRWVGHAVNFPA